MSRDTHSIPKAVERLTMRDHTLERIDVVHNRSTEEMAELVDCLLANPDVVKVVELSDIRLTGETGAKLAKYVAVSSTIKSLSMTHDNLDVATYLAMAEALRINSSLRYLCLCNNQVTDTKDKICIDAAFVNALIVNPNRPIGSVWHLYSWPEEDSRENDFRRLKATA